jgi:ATP-dependent RNA helicase DeaD
MTETDAEAAPPEELESFETFAPEIRRAVAEMGWTSPMPVQRRVTPVMRRGRDLIAQAMTGSGKTGAFGLPSLEIVDPKLRAPQVLVLAPTRELALQIENEIKLMGKYMGIETVSVYGGTAYGPQLEAFGRGAQIIVACPGRLLDHLSSGNVKLDAARAGLRRGRRASSLGFWPDMRERAEVHSEDAAHGPLSATMPQRVVSLARVFLTEPEFVSLTTGGVRAPEEIEHWHFIVAANEKEKALLRILRYEDPDSALVFCNTRDDVRMVTKFLQRNEIDADMIQGEMTQAAREAVMKRIKAGELRVLVATDVAARGIDISDLSHVISYTSPDSPEVYTHRTGRTGRAGKSGTAISLVSGLDIGNFRSLQKVNRIVIPERKLPTEAEVAKREAERLQVDIEHHLRDIPERDRQAREETHLPTVESLAATPQGRRLLSAVLFEYLEHRHVATPAREARPSNARHRPNARRVRSRGARRLERAGRRRLSGPSRRAGAAGAAASARRANVSAVRVAAAILIGVTLCGCALFRPRDRTDEIPPALADLAHAGFEFAPDVRFVHDPMMVCDRITCADLVLVSERRTIRLASGAFSSPSMLRASLLEIWPRYADAAARKRRGSGARRAARAKDGERADHRPGGPARGRFAYRQLWREVPSAERVRLPEPETLPVNAR